jgi:L-fuconolactonase
MRIDAHQHFWAYNEQGYGWMGPGMARLKQDHLPEDLKPLLEEPGIDGTVAVQARQQLAETEWLLGLANTHPFIKGVVGWVDLCSPGVGQELARLSGHDKLCGVRHVVHDEPNDRFMAQADFRRGIGMLAEYGLTYDLLLFPKHLPLAGELVAAFPEQRFIVDHLAKPRIKEGRLEPWAHDIQAIAAYPNVYGKVSGMVTEADWANWEAADFRPYLDIVFDAFGPDRLMFGSDWPVCTVAAAYPAVVGIVREYLADLSPSAQRAVMAETAIRAYDLA